MGLLSPSDWQAQWISFDGGPAGEMNMRPAPYLRRAFRVEQPIASATLFATARGLYRLHLSGMPVGETVFAPDWTDYNHPICYNAYDVTQQIWEGDNVVGAVLGDGWYCGHVGWNGGRNHYGKYPQLLAQLHLRTEDGRTVVVGTDEAWKASAGPILFSDLLMGESYDARRELPGWSLPGFDDAAWDTVASARAGGLPRHRRYAVVSAYVAREHCQPGFDFSSRHNRTIYHDRHRCGSPYSALAATG